MLKHFLIPLFLFAALFGRSFQINAQSVEIHAVVTMNNGAEQDYYLTGDDTFAFEGEETLVITSDGVTYRLAVNEIRKIVFMDTVETQEFDASSPFFFPNPVKNSITIGNVGENQPVRIYSIDGRLVRQFTASAQERIDLSSLPSGMYIIHFCEKNLKLLKQ